MSIERIKTVTVEITNNLVKWNHDKIEYWALLNALHDGYAEVESKKVKHCGHLKVEGGEVVWKLRTGVSGPFRPFATLGDYATYRPLRTVTAAMFIVPNPIDKIDPDNPIKELVFGALRNYNIPFDENELFVEVWVYGSKSENWSSHGAPCGLPQFPAYMPLSFIEDLQEREWITLRATTGHLVRLGALQSAGRYKNFGTFQETLKKLRARAQARVA